MDYKQFIASLEDAEPPASLSMSLKALWRDAKGQGELARRIAETDESNAGKWINAYLCRKGGDEREAEYLYWRAGVAPATGSTDEEWADIVQSLLAEGPVANAYGV